MHMVPNSNDASASYYLQGTSLPFLFSPSFLYVLVVCRDQLCWAIQLGQDLSRIVSRLGYGRAEL